METKQTSKQTNEKHHQHHHKQKQGNRIFLIIGNLGKLFCINLGGGGGGAPKAKVRQAHSYFTYRSHLSSAIFALIDNL